jgi:nitrite reductase/ring-hydroxylating ferredoxin subunit
VSAENGSAWHVLEGIDPQATTFPAAATFDGEPIWIFQTGLGLRGVSELCPHDNRSLGTARIVGNASMIRCSHHNYTFKLMNGMGVNCPGYRIAVYEVKEENRVLLARRCRTDTHLTEEIQA